jgi:hypothetical protein
MTRGLLDKLGFKPGMATRFLGVPNNLAGPLGPALQAQAEPPVWLMGFARDRAGLAAMVETLAPAYRPGGHFWLCYPKKSGPMKSDITRDHGWESVATRNLLGVSQISLDETWSALRFRYRDEIPTITRKTPADG